MTADQIDERSVVVTVSPSSAEHEGRLTVEDALEQVLDFLRIAEDAAASLARPHEAFVWYLKSASTNSPLTVVAVAEPVNPSVDVTSHVAAVKQATARVFRVVARGEPPPNWLSQSGAQAMRDFFHRNANGISVTVLDFNDGQRVEIDDSQAATAVSSFIEPLQLLEALPARSAHGEIDGRLIAVGRWRNKPALYLHTALYGNVWCVLAPHLIEQWGGETRVSSIWTGKRLSIFGRLLYWKGGRLSRVEAESVRERVSPRIDIEDVLDADFTAGLDPVEYLDRLHEGKLG